MRKGLHLTLLAFAVATCLTSCLKDDVNSTIIYSSQDIPDINTYMPHKLLEMMGNSRLHYGDEPPRFYEAPILAAHYYFKDLKCTEALYPHEFYPNDSIPAIPHQGNIIGSYQFDFEDQIKGIISSSYSSICPQGASQYVELSRLDSTYNYLKHNTSYITNSLDCPSYFTGSFDESVFKHAYVIGKDSYFTIYYYDVAIKDFADNWVYGFNQFYPLCANIISGKLTKFTELVPNANDSTVNDTINKFRLEHFCWGKELMGYFGDTDPNFHIFFDNGKLPYPGVVYTIDNAGLPVDPNDD